MNVTNVFWNHLPFILTSVVLPVIGILYIAFSLLFYAARERKVVTITSELYNIYLLFGIASVLVLDFVFFKVAYDYTYTTVKTAINPETGQVVTVFVTWNIIRNMSELSLYLSIVNILKPFYFLAGLSIGLSILVVLLRRVHRMWYLELLVYVVNPIIFIYSEIKPLQGIRYSYQLVNMLGIGTGHSPYSDYAVVLLTHWLGTGLVLGILLTVFIWVIVSRYATNIGVLSRFT